MLTHIPHEVVDEALRGPLPLYVFVHAYNSHEWDVFVPHATNVSRGGVFRCGPADANGDAVIDLLIYEVPAVGENYVDLRDYAEIVVKGGKLSKIVSTCRSPRMEIAA